MQTPLAPFVALAQAGGIFGLPTETVYGLAAHADDDAAVAKIFTLKGRPADHPLIVHVAADYDGAVAHYAAHVPAFARALMQAFWPGPLTLILPRNAGVAMAATGGQASVGLRCPAHPLAQALLQQCQAVGIWGLAAPSANRFGRISPTTAAHVHSEFGADFPVLDGGACAVGIESSIVDCTRGVPVLLRPGGIGVAALSTACGQRVWTPQEFHAAHQAKHVAANLAQAAQPAPKASGTLAAHYAPTAKLRLLSPAQWRSVCFTINGNAPGDASWMAELLRAAHVPSRGVTAPSPKNIALYGRDWYTTAPEGLYQRVAGDQGRTNVWQLAMPPDAAAAAHHLFAHLRQLDDLGVEEIWVQGFDGLSTTAADWAGVIDRLQRAAAS